MEGGREEGKKDVVAVGGEQQGRGREWNKGEGLSLIGAEQGRGPKPHRSGTAIERERVTWSDIS